MYGYPKNLETMYQNQWDPYAVTQLEWNPGEKQWGSKNHLKTMKVEVDLQKRSELIREESWLSLVLSFHWNFQQQLAGWPSHIEWDF